MSDSEPNPDRCHVTLLPLHMVRPGRLLKTNPLIARKESEKHQVDDFCADRLNISHLFRGIVRERSPSHRAFCCFQ